MTAATGGGHPTAPGNPLGWFAGTGRDRVAVPTAPGGPGAALEALVGPAAAPDRDLGLGCDAATSLRTGVVLETPPDPVWVAHLRLNMSAFRWLGTDTPWGRRVPSVTTLRSRPWVDGSGSGIAFGDRGPPEYRSYFDRVNRERAHAMIRDAADLLDRVADAPWPPADAPEADVWAAARAFVATTVVAVAGAHQAAAAAAAGFPGYHADPDRWPATPGAPAARPPPPGTLGGLTYTWDLVEVCTGDDTATWELRAVPGTGHATVAAATRRAPGPRAAWVALPPEVVLDTLRPRHARRYGGPRVPGLTLRPPWRVSRVIGIDVYRECVYAGRNMGTCLCVSTYGRASLDAGLGPLRNFWHHWTRYPSPTATTECYEHWPIDVDGGIFDDGTGAVIKTTRQRIHARITAPGVDRDGRSVRCVLHPGVPGWCGTGALNRSLHECPGVCWPSATDVRPELADVSRQLIERGDWDRFSCPRMPTDWPAPGAYNWYGLAAAHMGVPPGANATTGAWLPPGAGLGTEPGTLGPAAYLTDDIPDQAPPTTADFAAPYVTEANLRAAVAAARALDPDVVPPVETLVADWRAWRSHRPVNASFRAAATALVDAARTAIWVPAAAGVLVLPGNPDGWPAPGAAPPASLASHLRAVCGGTARPRDSCFYGLDVEAGTDANGFTWVSAAGAPGPGPGPARNLDLALAVASARGGPAFGFHPDHAATVATSAAVAALTPDEAGYGDSVPGTPTDFNTLGSAVVDLATGTLMCPVGMGGPTCNLRCGNLSGLVGTTLGTNLTARGPCPALDPRTRARSRGCYVPAPNGPLLAAPGCSGVGTCFSDAAPEVCVCPSGFTGTFCGACEPGLWPPPGSEAAAAGTPPCSQSCLGTLPPGADPGDASPPMAVVLVWDPTGENRGVYDLGGPACMNSTAWAASPAVAHLTLAAVIAACGLTAPVSGPAEWLARARACVLGTPPVTLGSLCPLQDVGCVATLGTTSPAAAAAVGVTADTLGCPPTDPAAAAGSSLDLLTVPAEVTTATRPALVAALTDPTTRELVAGVVAAAAALGVTSSGWAGGPGATLPTPCGCRVPGPAVCNRTSVVGLALGAATGTGTGTGAFPSACSACPAVSGNTAAVLARAGGAVPGLPTVPDPSWRWAAGWPLCDPVVFRQAVALSGGPPATAGLNPLAWGVCVPVGGIRPRWLSPWGFTLCGWPGPEADPASGTGPGPASGPDAGAWGPVQPRDGDPGAMLHPGTATGPGPSGVTATGLWTWPAWLPGAVAGTRTAVITWAVGVLTAAGQLQPAPTGQPCVPASSPDGTCGLDTLVGLWIGRPKPLPSTWTAAAASEPASPFALPWAVLGPLPLAAAEARWANATAAIAVLRTALGPGGSTAALAELLDLVALAGPAVPAHVADAAVAARGLAGPPSTLTRAAWLKTGGGLLGTCARSSWDTAGVRTGPRTVCAGPPAGLFLCGVWGAGVVPLPAPGTPTSDGGAWGAPPPLGCPLECGTLTGPTAAATAAVVVGNGPGPELGCPAALLTAALGGGPAANANVAARLRGAAALAAMAALPGNSSLCHPAVLAAANVGGAPEPPGTLPGGIPTSAIEAILRSLPGLLEDAVVEAAKTTGARNATTPGPAAVGVVGSPARAAAARQLTAVLATYAGVGIPTMATFGDPFVLLASGMLARLEVAFPQGIRAGFSCKPPYWAFVRRRVAVESGSTTPVGVCGGPARADTCPTGPNCAAPGYVPCASNPGPVAAADGVSPLNAFNGPDTTPLAWCGCRPAGGCVCRAGSNLDPASRCTQCMPGAVPVGTASAFVACEFPSGCPAWGAPPVPCGGRGWCATSCVPTGAGAGVAVPAPFNPDNITQVATGCMPGTLELVCVCDAGWTGPGCADAVPPPVTAQRVGWTSAVPDAASSVVARAAAEPRVCAPSGPTLVVAVSSVAAYAAACATEGTRGGGAAAATECGAALREYAALRAYWVYGGGPGAGTGGASALRAPRVTDTAMCGALGGTLATTGAWARAPPATRTALGAWWATAGTRPGDWPPNAATATDTGTGTDAGVARRGALAAATRAGMSPAEAVALRGGPGGWTPPGHPDAATACVRVLAPNGTAVTVVAPLDGRLVPAAPPGDGPYPHAGGVWVPPPGAPVCAFYTHPLCELPACVPGQTLIPPTETIL
jgi:hypothetical protein